MKYVIKIKVTLQIDISLSIYWSLNVHIQRLQFYLIVLPSPLLLFSLQLCSVEVKNKTEKCYLLFCHLTDTFHYDFYTVSFLIFSAQLL